MAIHSRLSHRHSSSSFSSTGSSEMDGLNLSGCLSDAYQFVLHDYGIVPMPIELKQEQLMPMRQRLGARASIAAHTSPEIRALKLPLISPIRNEGIEESTVSPDHTFPFLQNSPSDKEIKHFTVSKLSSSCSPPCHQRRRDIPFKSPVVTNSAIDLDSIFEDDSFLQTCDSSFEESELNEINFTRFGEFDGKENIKPFSNTKNVSDVSDCAKKLWSQQQNNRLSDFHNSSHRKNEPSSCRKYGKILEEIPIYLDKHAPSHIPKQNNQSRERTGRNGISSISSHPIRILQTKHNHKNNINRMKKFQHENNNKENEKEAIQPAGSNTSQLSKTQKTGKKKKGLGGRVIKSTPFRERNANLPSIH